MKEDFDAESLQTHDIRAILKRHAIQFDPTLQKEDLLLLFDAVKNSFVFDEQLTQSTSAMEVDIPSPVSVR